jgi:hypothetical protein
MNFSLIFQMKLWGKVNFKNIFGVEGKKMLFLAEN